jgi:hypothetical protein
MNPDNRENTKCRIKMPFNQPKLRAAEGYDRVVPKSGPERVL